MSDKRYPGTVVEIAVAFTDASAAAFDPDDVTFKVKTPAGDVETFVYGTDEEVVKDATGEYHMDYLLETSGDYPVRVEGSGDKAAAIEDTITVEESSFA